MSNFRYLVTNVSLFQMISRYGNVAQNSDILPILLYKYRRHTIFKYIYNEHSGGCRRQPSTPAEGGRRAKLVCRYRVYHLSEAIKLKTRRPPTGFLVLQPHHSHTCNIWGTSAFLPMGCNDWFTFQYFHAVFCMQ